MLCVCVCVWMQVMCFLILTAADKMKQYLQTSTDRIQSNILEYHQQQERSTIYDQRPTTDR